jgi:hypothetical protein
VVKIVIVKESGEQKKIELDESAAAGKAPAKWRNRGETAEPLSPPVKVLFIGIN